MAFRARADTVKLPELAEPMMADLCVNECLNLDCYDSHVRLFEMEIDISGSSVSNATLVSIGDTRGEYLEYSNVIFQFGVSQTNIYLRCNDLKNVHVVPAPDVPAINLRMRIRQDNKGNPLYIKFTCNGIEFQFPELDLSESIPDYFRPLNFKSLKFTRRGTFTGGAPTGTLVMSPGGLRLIVR